MTATGALVYDATTDPDGEGGDSDSGRQIHEVMIADENRAEQHQDIDWYHERPGHSYMPRRP